MEQTGQRRSDARELSHWGWGWADRFPPPEERRALGELVCGLLGAGQVDLVEPVPLDQATIRPSRVTLPDTLRSFSTTDDASRARAAHGRSFPDLVRGFVGDFTAAPDAVCQPETEEQVIAALQWAEQSGVAVVPRGGGTSVTGGVDGSAIDRPWVSLELRRMNRLLEVDAASRAVRVQGGATGPELEAQLKAHGLTLRHFPQSWEFSTVGGWVATRAGGHFATVYTHIDEFVQSVRMVSPRGVWQSPRLPASGAGPAWDRLVIGSEGILGIITEAWLRVQTPPQYRSTASIHFREYDDAVAAARALAQGHLHPSNCRLLDAREAMINAVTGDGSHVLIVGFESADCSTEPDMERALAICLALGGSCPAGPKHRSGGARTGTEGAAGSWRESFIDGPYRQNVLLSAGFIADTFETATTWERFPALHADIVRSVRAAMQAQGGAGIISCRFTHVYPDGPAPYYTWIMPGDRSRLLEQWQVVKTAAADALRRHEATISHHHAVGRIHQPWYRQERPELFARMLAASKRVADPAAVLNPGVLLADDELERG